jgi:hypothetical protein
MQLEAKMSDQHGSTPEAKEFKTVAMSLSRPSQLTALRTSACSMPLDEAQLDGAIPARDHALSLVSKLRHAEN